MECKNCAYCCEDKKASITIGRVRHTAYECTNDASPYFTALLNVTTDGNFHENDEVRWEGCEEGTERHRLSEVDKIMQLGGKVSIARHNANSGRITVLIDKKVVVSDWDKDTPQKKALEKALFLAVLIKKGSL